MAVEWNVTNIKDYEANFPDVVRGEEREWNPVTVSLVWVSIPCAWGWKLTEENYEEAFMRIHMYEHTRGAMRSKAGADGKAEEVFFTLDEVKKHIGFSVNVSPITKAQFDKKLAGMQREDARRELQRQAKAAA